MLYAKMLNSTKSSGGEYWTFCERIINAPHTLIAGTTGSGKSTLINSILWTFCAIKPPSDRLILIDPKRVDLAEWQGLPHTDFYTTELNGVITALNGVIDEMSRRYASMSIKGVKKYENGGIWLVIDELADLMISERATEIKLLLQKILQLGRASNIHVIAATQAPNRTIIPASLVLNFTDRIGLRCLSPIESRQIIGVKGCETLNLIGECLYRSGATIERYEVPFTPDDKIKKRLAFWGL